MIFAITVSCACGSECVCAHLVASRSVLTAQAAAQATEYDEVKYRQQSLCSKRSSAAFKQYSGIVRAPRCSASCSSCLAHHDVASAWTPCFATVVTPCCECRVILLILYILLSVSVTQ